MSERDFPPDLLDTDTRDQEGLEEDDKNTTCKFILTIKAPHWHEPIVLPVREVYEETKYHDHSFGGRGRRLIKATHLLITHSDGTWEQFRLGDNYSYTVELNEGYCGP